MTGFPRQLNRKDTWVSPQYHLPELPQINSSTRFDRAGGTGGVNFATTGRINRGRREK